MLYPFYTSELYCLSSRLLAQAIVCRRQHGIGPTKDFVQAEVLTVEHVPRHPLEKARIDAAGGKVTRAGRPCVL